MERKTQQIGFTLIEMLIVIAIVGILSAVALPIYQQYIARAQLKEGVSLGMSAQPLIEDYVHRTGSFPATAQLGALGLPVNSTNGTILGSASATIATVTTSVASNSITITLQGNLRPEVAATTIIYTKSDYAASANATTGAITVTDPGSWSCLVNMPGTSDDMDLLPDGCLLDAT